MSEILEEWGTPEEKAAHNQSLFRAVNEQIRVLHESEALADDFGPPAPADQWVCECANAGCMERISLSVEEYAAVRAAGNRFAIAPGEAHFFAEVEDVTDRRPAYWVVEKTGKAKVIAENLSERYSA